MVCKKNKLEVVKSEIKNMEMNIYRVGLQAKINEMLGKGTEALLKEIDGFEKALVFLKEEEERVTAEEDTK